MNLTENQVKRLRPLLIKLVNEVKQEIGMDDTKYNEWNDAKQSILKIGSSRDYNFMNKSDRTEIKNHILAITKIVDGYRDTYNR